MTTKAKKSPAETLEILTEATEKVVEAVAETSRETLETMTKASSGAFADSYEKASKFGADQMGQTSEVYEQAVKMGKQNMDTMTAVMSAMTAGMEAYNTRLMESWMGAAATKMDCCEKLMGAKTPQDAAAMQMAAFKTLSESAVAEATELNKIAADTMTKAAAPMKARFEEVMETVAKA